MENFVEPRDIDRFRGRSEKSGGIQKKNVIGKEREKGELTVELAWLER